MIKFNQVPLENAVECILGGYEYVDAPFLYSPSYPRKFWVGGEYVRGYKQALNLAQAIKLCRGYIPKIVYSYGGKKIYGY